jgi:proteic killer suppression protein
MIPMSSEWHNVNGTLMKSFAALFLIDVTTVNRYHQQEIRSFASRPTETIWNGDRARSLPPDIQNVCRRKLRMLNNAERLPDLRLPPANRLEKLSGNRTGQYSIRVNDQWRICFRWEDGDAYDVELVDYH